MNRKLMVILLGLFFLVSCAHEKKVIVYVNYTSVDEEQIAVKTSKEKGIDAIIYITSQPSQWTKVVGNEAIVTLPTTLRDTNINLIKSDLYIVRKKYPKVNQVTFIINCSGGDANFGLSLANTIEELRNRGYKTVAYGSGIVGSAALLIYSVCEVRYAYVDTEFLFHEVQIILAIKEISTTLFKQISDHALRLNEKYQNIFLKYTKADLKKLKELDELKFFTAQEAKELGLVDEIIK